MKGAKRKTGPVPGASTTAAPESPSPITLLRELQNGSLAPAMLTVESRRACVEHLTSDGYSVAETSEVLKVSPRTVHRDLAQIRETNAVHRDPGLIDQFVGELVQQARQSIARLRRITRERDCPHSTRVEAERSAWTVAKELTETLQRLGFLPTAAQEIRADLTHRMEGPPSFDELHSQIESLEVVLQQAGGSDPVSLAGLGDLKKELARFRAGEQIELLTQAAQVQGSVVSMQEAGKSDAGIQSP